MDGGRRNSSYENDNVFEELRRSATQTIPKIVDQPTEQPLTARIQPLKSTIRTVTPEPAEDDDSFRSQTPTLPLTHDISSQISPRSIPGGEKSKDRRQGLVFDDTFDASDSSPPQPPPTNKISSYYTLPKSHTRPRTRTLEEPRRQRQVAASISKSRHRIGSVHSTSSTGFFDEERTNSELSTLGLPSVVPNKPSQIQKSRPIYSNIGGSQQYLKKPSSRASSPVSSSTVDSLPVPFETTDANKILKLMKSLSGRMRGAVEYQIKADSWISGTCYIDEIKGSLMCEGEAENEAPFYVILIKDLRGCRVRPARLPDKNGRLLEITTTTDTKIRLLPLVSTEFEHWLAALLSWQQIRPGTTQINLSVSESADFKSDSLSRSSSFNPLKDSNIIKVGKLLLWDKGALLSPTSILRRSSGKDPRPAHRLWRRVSCILKDNGEFKLLTENDVSLLSVIQLSQLSRCAIQQLDRSVLNEEYCIGIFPQYSMASTSISIIRPVYIALESRVLFEVWFVLLRAFAIPELYGSLPPLVENEQSIDTDSTDDYANSNDMFRIEKTLNVRVTEAKLRKLPANLNLSSPAKTPKKLESSLPARNPAKSELDLLVGDYFVEVILDGEIRSRTTTRAVTKNPFWREDYKFVDLPPSLPNLLIVLKRMTAPIEVSALSVRSSTSIHSTEPMIETTYGTVEIHLDQVERGKDIENWWPILDDKLEPVGELFLKIRHEEIVVLLAKDYQPISELLHRFCSSLTVQIARAIPSKLRTLSETLMNIFQVSGQSNAWLMALAEDEIDGIGKETAVGRFRFNRRVGSNDSFDSVGEREQTVRDMGKSLTGEANLLFRGNSLLTQALDFHMRRLGKEYLEEVLLDKIYEINNLNPNCEVDPSRLSPGDDLNKNWLQLTALTTGLWESIASSAKRCPAELRQILKFIRAVADDRYGDFLRTVSYTSVSGFLFLRFFCPAILNPKLFGLLRDHPRSKAQRTLTLIAKSLQVLANLSTFGQKEAWMEPMNKFLASHRQEVKEFIGEICSIPAERGTFAVPASYSTPITILGRLPPTSREGFPSLPYLIDHARNFASLVKLWLDSTKNITSNNLEGELFEFHEHCVSLQRRTDECVLKAEQSDKSSDNHSLRWDDVVSSLSHSALQPPSSHSPPTIINPEVTVPAHHPVIDQALTESPTEVHFERAPPYSADGESNSKERRERQSFWEQAFGPNLKSQRPYISFQREEIEKEDRASSPPSRGASRNGKGQKGFLSGLRKKGSGKSDEKERENLTARGVDGRQGFSWSVGMI